MNDTLKITDDAQDSIKAAVTQAGHRECMGLLAGGPEGVVTLALLLPGAADAASATASPEVLQQAADLLRSLNARPLGLFHSHAAFDVFHSRTDETTIDRLIPALALGSSTPWPRVSTGLRLLTADTVELQSASGILLRLSLVGPPVPGTDGHERATWSRLAFGDCGKPADEPRVVLAPDSVQVECGGTTLLLGVPPGASVSASRDDDRRSRRADLYSMVINRRFDLYCEAVTVFSVDGERIVRRARCDVEVIATDAGKDRALALSPLGAIRLIGCGSVGAGVANMLGRMQLGHPRREKHHDIAI